MSLCSEVSRGSRLTKLFFFKLKKSQNLFIKHYLEEEGKKRREGQKIQLKPCCTHSSRFLDKSQSLPDVWINVMVGFEKLLLFEMVSRICFKIRAEWWWGEG